jgi:hypothetical protein
VNTVDQVVQAKPVTAVVTPVVEIVAPIIAAVPVVSDVVGSTPVAEVVTPVADAVEDSLGGDSSPSDASDLSTGTAVIDAMVDATDVNATNAVTFSATGWAASLAAVAATAGSTAVADTTFPTAPGLPVGDAPLPAALNASGSASSGGPAGAGLVATLAGTETAAPLSGSLLCRAGDDSIPPSLAQDHGSTPD